MLRCSFLLALLLCCLARAIGAERPNIVIIVSDDHGTQDFGFAVNTAVRTPHLDRLAGESMRFTRFHQSPACAPTRASLLTGRDALAAGVWGVHRGKDYLHPDEYTLAHALSAADYATGCFGKWHNGKTLGFRARDVGFTTEVIADASPYRYFNQTLNHDGRTVSVAGPQDDVLVDRAIAFVETETAAGRPWLCYLPFPSVHEPLMAPADMIARYRDQGLPEQLATLYAMIERQDHNIGRLLSCIDELDQRQNTIVMFMVDDGHKRLSDPAQQRQRESAWRKRLRGGKASLYQGGLLSPLLVRWPGVCEAGRRSAVLASVNDLFPTLVEVCDLTLPDEHLGFHGISLAEVLRGRDAAVPTDRWFGVNKNFYLQKGGGVTGAEAYSMSKGPERAVLQGSFKYVGRGNTWALYDLSADPFEQQDVRTRHPKQAAAMQELAKRYWQRCLASPHALYLPRFRIGGWDHPLSRIYPYAPKDMRGGVKRVTSNHVLGGFDRAGATVVYPVRIREAGSYRIHLESHMKHGSVPQGVVRATIADASVDIPLDGRSWRTVSQRIDLAAGDADLVLSVVDPGPDGHGLGALSFIGIERIEGADTVLPGLRLEGCDALTAEGGRIRLRADEAWASASAWLDFEPAQVDADGWITVPPWLQPDRLSINIVATASDGRRRRIQASLRIETPSESTKEGNSK